jgi:hypothetical protein
MATHHLSLTHAHYGAHWILDCVNGGAEGLVLCDEGASPPDYVEHSSSVGEGDRPRAGFDFGRADNTRFHAYGNGSGVLRIKSSSEVFLRLDKWASPRLEPAASAMRGMSAAARSAMDLIAAQHWGIPVVRLVVPVSFPDSN